MFFRLKRTSAHSTYRGPHKNVFLWGDLQLSPRFVSRGPRCERSEQWGGVSTLFQRSAKLMTRFVISLSPLQVKLARGLNYTNAFAPFYFLAASIKPLKSLKEASSLSIIHSGCHCTPTPKGRSVATSASVTPSVA